LVKEQLKWKKKYLTFSLNPDPVRLEEAITKPEKAVLKKKQIVLNQPQSLSSDSIALVAASSDSEEDSGRLSQSPVQNEASSMGSEPLQAASSLTLPFEQESITISVSCLA
jgi:hypothetical protein